MIQRFKELIPFCKVNLVNLELFKFHAFYGSNGGVLQNHADIRITKGANQKNFTIHAKTINACSATIITNPLLEDHSIYESTIKDFIRDERIGQITHLQKKSRG